VGLSFLEEVRIGVSYCRLEINVKQAAIVQRILYRIDILIGITCFNYSI